LALLIVDIDHFKRYNDTLGHPQGDLCLVKVARGLQERIFRPGDFVTRYGGEEFAILLTESDLDGAYLVAERIRESVEALKIDHPASPTNRYVTVSVGVAATVPARDLDPETLLRAADQAPPGCLEQLTPRVSFSANCTTLHLTPAPMPIRLGRVH
jgi:diguanylate cyclase (GGDEF)-like protein